MLYLLASSGILVGQHLCMGRVKEAALFSKVEKNCGMPMDMHQDMEGCCEDELILKRVEDEQQVAASKEAPKADYHLLYEVPWIEIMSEINSSEEEVQVNNTGPPDKPGPDLFLLYQQLKLPALQS